MRLLAAALAASIVIAAGARAEAYCRSAACPPREDGSTDGHVCNPPEPDDCGVEIQWRQPCIGFSVQTDASSQIDFDTAEAVLAEAFAAWTSVDCGTGRPSVTVYDLGEVSCGAVEYNQHAGNANVLVFRDDVWPHATDIEAGVADTLALTTVTYDIEKGDIYDADIEVNTANNHFTTTDAPGPDDVDLLSVLTHEAGHFLGLAHNIEDDASTMTPNYARGSTDLRTLDVDDETAICAAYPPEREATGTCTAIPRHGFAPDCGDEQTYVKCSAAPADGGGAAGFGVIALAAAVALARRSAKPTARCGIRGS
jgi:MYXO-CTERM domain-containing protein